MSRLPERAVFQPLREHLLRGGVSPRQVERYVLELRNHFEDIFAEQHEAGVPSALAETQALERLGSPQALYAFMLAQPRPMAWSTRAPITAYVGAPLLGLAAFAALVTLLLVTICKATSVGQTLHEPMPAWVLSFASAVVQAVNSAAPVLAAWLVCGNADRRRARPLWPSTGIALLALSPLGRLVLSPPPMKGSPGEIDLAFDLLAAPGHVLTHVAVNLALMATPYFALHRWRTLRLRRAGLA